MGFFDNERWGWIKTEWSAGNYSKAASLLLNGLPNMTYPGVYDETQDHNPLSPIFWWRELFHFAGGFIIGLSLLWMCPVLSVLCVAGPAFYKEFFMDAKEQPEGKWDFKNVVDASAWTLGCLVLNLLV